MTINYSALKIELLTGSFASLYSANIAIGNFNGLADTLNTPGLTGSSITIGLASALTLQQCVVGSEYIALTQAQRDLWNMLITTAGSRDIAISNTNIRGQVTTIWSAGTTTRTNLTAIQTRSCSRGETLFGEGTTVDTTTLYVTLTQ